MANEVVKDLAECFPRTDWDLRHFVFSRGVSMKKQSSTATWLWSCREMTVSVCVWWNFLSVSNIFSTVFLRPGLFWIPFPRGHFARCEIFSIITTVYRQECLCACVLMSASSGWKPGILPSKHLILSKPISTPSSQLQCQWCQGW